MSKIRIKNFGPIKEGYLENDGWMDIKKVTLFIGNQGSGKSTVAKLISTFLWMEKALLNGNLLELNRTDFIEEQCNYFRLKKYFRPETELYYEGDYCEIIYINENIEYNLKPHHDIYYVPKIMYVPAERSFLSSVEGADKVSGLPQPLVTFMVENDRSLKELGGPLSLPLGDYQIKYDSTKKICYIAGNGYELELSAASSGLHSVVPLYVVSRNLSGAIASGKTDTSVSELSSRQLQKKRAELRGAKIDTILNDSDEQATNLEAIIESKYKNSFFVNIVEEPEQNLFPASQKTMLDNLVEFNNMSVANKLIMTTHSPYLINYMSLAVKAFKVHETLNALQKNVDDRIKMIVPLESVVDPNSLIIYELDEKLGTIIKLKDYKGIPSDENYLNNSLAETNEQFAQLQEIEKGWL